MNGYKIEIREQTTARGENMFEVTPFGLYPENPLANAYMFYSVEEARAHAKSLGRQLGFHVHDFTI